jgi:hypothetical protein
MKADSLLRLYPRAWRERYGDEFLALFDNRPVELPQLIDIVSGAIDAHLSSDVRATTVARRSAVHVEGDAAVLTRKSICYNNAYFPFSAKDAWIGSGVMLAATLAFTGASLLHARRHSARDSRPDHLHRGLVVNPGAFQPFPASEPPRPEPLSLLFQQAL